MIIVGHLPVVRVSDWWQHSLWACTRPPLWPASLSCTTWTRSEVSLCAASSSPQLNNSLLLFIYTNTIFILWIVSIDNQILFIMNIIIFIWIVTLCVVIVGCRFVWPRTVLCGATGGFRIAQTAPVVTSSIDHFSIIYLFFFKYLNYAVGWGS